MYTVELLIFIGLIVAWSNANPEAADLENAFVQTVGSQISQALGSSAIKQAIGSQVSQAYGPQVSQESASQFPYTEGEKSPLLSFLGLSGLQPRDFTVPGVTNIGLDIVEESAEGSSSKLVKLLGLTQFQGKDPATDVFLGVLIFIVGFIGSLVGLGPSKIEQLINTASG